MRTPKQTSRLFPILIACTALLVAYCATPTQPTGGPQDKEGPNVVKTEPETGTVNFSGREIVLHFDEFVRRESLRPALSVQPDLGIEYEIDWGRKSVAVVFKRDLPDSTTAILTVGTELKDMNGNELSTPVQVAVSTGSRIDSGKLFGRLRTAENGSKESGWQVLLYQQPVDLTDKARYVGETDTSGNIKFQYLSAGTYKALWVDDRNRNQRWDPESEWAQPFPREFVQLKRDQADTLGTLYVQQRDTTAPRLLGVGLLSSRRLRLRFSENVQWADTVRPVITDTLGAPATMARPLYRPAREPFVMMARSRDALDPQQTYNIEFAGITDSRGNAVKPSAQTFTGSAQEDTTLQRIIEHNAENGLLYDQPLVVTYAAPLSENGILDSLQVVEGDTLLEEWPGGQADFNKLIVRPQERWDAGLSYQFRIWNPIKGDYEQISPTIMQPDNFGAVEIVRADTTDSTHFQVQLYNENRQKGYDTSGRTSMVIEQLPPGTYRLRAYIDRNGNGRWDPGTVDPHVAPEPYFVRRNVPVEPSMTGQVTVELGQ